MTDALHRVIASTYPKLEIIVLDDLSADKTPALIKAFAQDGVRFIEGGPFFRCRSSALIDSQVSSSPLFSEDFGSLKTCGWRLIILFEISVATS